MCRAWNSAVTAARHAGAVDLEVAGMLAAEHYRMKIESRQRGIIFSFNGFISESILFALGKALKRKLSLDAINANTMKRVFSVFVEQAQNIIRYSCETLDRDALEDSRISSGLITVGSEDGRFFVNCGNVMRRDDARPLQARLEQLRGLDPAGIKAFYLEKIKAEAEPTSLGANLGLIEIARRASEPIQYDFLDIDDATTFYCLKVFI
jgi:hypothetical protein